MLTPRQTHGDSWRLPAGSLRIGRVRAERVADDSTVELDGNPLKASSARRMARGWDAIWGLPVPAGTVCRRQVQRRSSSPGDSHQHTHPARLLRLGPARPAHRNRPWASSSRCTVRCRRGKVRTTCGLRRWRLRGVGRGYAQRARRTPRMSEHVPVPRRVSSEPWPLLRQGPC